MDLSALITGLTLGLMMSDPRLNFSQAPQYFRLSLRRLLWGPPCRGVFVPNISYGLPVLKAVADSARAELDVHLMITDPLRYVERFAEKGADIITVHLESESDTAETIEKIHSLGKKAGLAIKPKTPVSAAET